MGLLQACRTTATRVIVLNVAALSGDALAQPVQPERDEASATTRESLAALTQRAELAARRVEAIREEESRNGPHSEALIDMLVSLGLFYQESGRHDLAVASLERALQVQRVNHGLYTLDQIPMIRQLIGVEQARGNFAAVQALNGRLIRLARSNRDKLRTVPILHEAADRQLDVYVRYLDHELPPEMSVNLHLGSGPRQGFSSNRSLASFSLRQARRNYREAIGVILRAGSYESGELPELERKLIHSYYLEASSGDPAPNRMGTLYHLGKEAHRRLVAYSGLATGSAVELAIALVELADWELLFSRNGTALERYREAYDLLVEHGAPPTLLEAIFYPATPVTLPAFLPNPLDSDETRPARGYMDVAFELSKYGKSRKIEILEAGGDTDAAPEKDLVRLIARNRFRPRLTDDGTDTSALVLRYHY